MLLQDLGHGCQIQKAPVYKKDHLTCRLPQDQGVAATIAATIGDLASAAAGCSALLFGSVLLPGMQGTWGHAVH